MKQDDGLVLAVDGLRGMRAFQTLLKRYDIEGIEDWARDIILIDGPQHQEYLEACIHVQEHGFVFVGEERMTLAMRDGDILFVPDDYQFISDDWT